VLHFLLRCLDFEELVMGPSDTGVRFLGWMAHGACQRTDPELFFPIGAGGASMGQISAAKAICQSCTVRTPCLSYGLATCQDGIWGGTTLEERLSFRQQADSPPHSSDGPHHVPNPPETSRRKLCASERSCSSSG
jgi:WhiB family transcriptional regulator, redox-sensing transcriptional regulator